MQRLAYLSILLFSFTVPLEATILFEGFGSLSRAIGVGVLIVSILAIMERRYTRPMSLIFVVMCLYVFLTYLSWFWSSSESVAFATLLTNLQLLVMVFLVIQLIDGQEKYEQILQVYVLGAVILAAMTIQVRFSSELVERFAPVNYNLNEAGIICVAATPLAWHLQTVGRKRFWVIVNRLAIVLLIAGVFLTASRGAFLALGGLGILFIWSYFKVRFIGKIVILVNFFLIMLFIQAVVPTESIARLSTLSNELQTGDLNGRLIIWEAGYEVWVDHPILGVGAGNFPRAAARHDPLAIKGSHNSFLVVLVELGIIGASVMVLFVISMIVATRHLPAVEWFFWQANLLTLFLSSISTELDQAKFLWLLIAIFLARISMLRHIENAMTLEQSTS